MQNKIISIDSISLLSIYLENKLKEITKYTKNMGIEIKKSLFPVVEDGEDHYLSRLEIMRSKDSMENVEVLTIDQCPEKAYGTRIIYFTMHPINLEETISLAKYSKLSNPLIPAMKERLIADSNKIITAYNGLEQIQVGECLVNPGINIFYEFPSKMVTTFQDIAEDFLNIFIIKEFKGLSAYIH